MYYVGSCPKCKQGLLGVRVCSGEEKHLVIICDECDATWKSPEITPRATYPQQPDLPCPICGASLREIPARWATMRDVKKIGWNAKIAGYVKRRGI